MKQNFISEKTRYLLFTLATLGFALLTSGLVIWGEISSREPSIESGRGLIMVMMAIIFVFISYILLGIGVSDNNEKGGKVARWIFTMIPAITGAGIAIGIGTVSPRGGLLISAGLVGIGLSRYLDPMLQGFHSTRFYKIDPLRQAIIMFPVMIMSVLYVSMPALLINISH